jgi:ankyrin repeat protein
MEELPTTVKVGTAASLIKALNDPKLSKNKNSTFGLSGDTLLTLAIKRGDAGIVKVLIDNGVSYIDDDGTTPLMYAIERKEEKIVKFLIVTKPGDINKLNTTEETALTKSIELEDSDLVKLLLDNGADITVGKTINYDSLPPELKARLDKQKSKFRVTPSLVVANKTGQITGPGTPSGEVNRFLGINGGKTRKHRRTIRKKKKTRSRK